MYTLLAIKAEKEKVVDSLKEFFVSKGILSEEKTNYSIAIMTHEEWTVLIFNSVLPMPIVSKTLSEKLNTEVVTFGYEDHSGSSHYSVVENGELKKIYTYGMGDEVAIEKEGLTLMEVYEKAIQKKQFNLMPGYTPTEESLEYDIFPDFFSAYAEVDFQAIAEGDLDGEEEILYVKSYPFGQYGFNPDNNTWKGLLSESES